MSHVGWDEHRETVTILLLLEMFNEKLGDSRILIMLVTSTSLCSETLVWSGETKKCIRRKASHHPAYCVCFCHALRVIDIVQWNENYFLDKHGILSVGCCLYSFYFVVLQDMFYTHFEQSWRSSRETQTMASSSDTEMNRRGNSFLCHIPLESIRYISFDCTAEISALDSGAWLGW